MKPNLASLFTYEQILDALDSIDRNAPSLEKSTKFDLIHNGKSYPPKAVVREAARLVGITDLTNYRQNGGPPTNSYLEKLGFAIQLKNSAQSTGPAELIDALLGFLNQTPFGTPFGKYRYTDKNIEIAMGARGGFHDAKTNPGYVFTSDANQLLFRFIKYDRSASIVVENLKRQYQLSNYSLEPGKTFLSAEGTVKLVENHRMTVQTAQPYRISKEAMLKAGFPEDDVILTYEDPTNDATEIIENLLEWAEIKEKAKDLIKQEQKTPQQNIEEYIMPPNAQLNTILYGPPGTGKTYQTIDRALAIIDPEYYQRHKENRQKLLERFRNLIIKDWSIPAGRIAFITFHQSMSYEDFIEGIKPDVIEGDDGEKENITYEVQDGVFKLMAEKASWRKGNFDDVFEAFKASIDEGKGKPPIKIAAKYTTFDVVYRGTTVLHVKPKSSKKENAWYPVSIVNIRKAYETGTHANLYNYTYVREILEYLKREKGLQTPTKILKAEPHVIIIDEINRGNVARIFGELITLLEPDKRQNEKEELEVLLPYSKLPFSVPNNLYVIGTMNTADRSVEALDSALRRRFHFEEIPPQPDLLRPERMLWKFWWDNEGFSWEDREFRDLEAPFYGLLGFPAEKNTKEEKGRYWDPMWEEKTRNERQIETLRDLASSFTGVNLCELLNFINHRLERLLSKDHLIGHAFFINTLSVEDLKTTFFNKVIPLLQEYFYGDYGRIGLVIGKAFIEVKNQVRFMQVNGYETDLNESNLYRIRRPEDFKDDEEFITGIKAVYASK